MHGQYPGPKPFREGGNFRNKGHALPLGCSLAGTGLGLFCNVFLSITRIGQQYEQLSCSHTEEMTSCFVAAAQC